MIAFALLVTALPRVSFAADMDYPELQVVPRASERLKMEAEKESGFKLVSWPILVPAAGLLGVAALNANGWDVGKDPNRMGTNIPLITGLAWTGISLFLAASWSPYRGAWNNVKDASASGKREQLARERLAEEGLSAAARSSFVISLAATITLGASSALGMMMANSTANSLISATVGLLSFAPLIIGMYPTHVYNQHLEYKKKIYGPISSFTLMPEPITSRLAPGVSIALGF